LMKIEKTESWTYGHAKKITRLEKKRNPPSEWTGLQI
jgi:hypothetical protein